MLALSSQSVYYDGQEIEQVNEPVIAGRYQPMCYDVFRESKIQSKPETCHAIMKGA
jgi:hypothetical protein